MNRVLASFPSHLSDPKSGFAVKSTKDWENPKRQSGIKNWWSIPPKPIDTVRVCGKLAFL